ncbi:MAG TPA: VWA domain-containing protein [Phaeodactylibacter sp.]|nr:VWA domain-containing protein [Phaeodactylibacter sp.]
MFRPLFFLLSILLLSPTNALHNPTPKDDAKPKVQIALLLDTSNSMDGLIEQAKSQLWKMVNELALTEKDGQSPDIEIALYEYGNDGLNSREGYIRQVSALTTDLDLISEKLFSLTTNGGEEYCGWVIGNATAQLEWSKNQGDLKLIIIAGNEPFDQGPRDFRESCKTAISHGIQINTIFCGNYEEGVRTHWKKGADLADGLYFNIDPNAEVVYIPTPYDDEILRLNEELNKTYIYYGAHGKEMSARQEAQDANAASMGQANMASRASFKAKKQYNNAEWDIVDAMEEDPDLLEEVADEQLPEEMQGMSLEEREAYVKEMAAKREKIRAQILELDQKARAYRAEKEREMNEEKDANTLDAVMLKALRQQAGEKGFGG